MVSAMAHPVATQVDMEFVIPAPGESAVTIIDVARSLSLINRKSLRSGYVYSIDYLEYIGMADDEITIFKIPEGYVTNRAWSNGFAVWRQQRSDAMDNEGTSPGKWADFKCWMSEPHYLGAFPELLPTGMNAAATAIVDLATTGSEWNRADIVVNDVAAATTHDVAVGMLGAENSPSYGALIQAWGDTRAGTVAPDPNQPGMLSLSWISRTGAESSDMSVDVLNLIEEENDNPPYANETDPANTAIYVGGSESAVGGVSHDSALVGTTGRAVGLSGGLFPLGLIGISCAGASLGTRILRIHVSRGKYKGVSALKIGDFR